VSGPLLDIRHLSTHYVSARGTRVTRAVDDVTLMLDQGQTLGIVGESGSGKTTLALTLLRMLPPAARIVSGEMLFEGSDLIKKPEHEMRRIRGKRIAMILQDPMMSLNPLFTVGDQVAEPIRVHEGAPRRSAWKRATDLLKAVRIAAPETRVREYPAPALGRHAAAHRRRDRDLVRAADSHRR
jgi:ABC-type dipeptide/oligopeptide/nickel transport system ATPase component